MDIEEPIDVVAATIDQWSMMEDLFASSAGVNSCWCMWPLRLPQTHEPDYGRNKAEMRSLLLIEAATEQAKQHGAGSIEGPPPWWLPGDADAVSLATEAFVANGFAQIGQGARMPELRLELSDA